MRAIVLTALAVACLAGPAAAQSMPLEDFVTQANRVPLNPTSALRADARRLIREFRAAMSAVSAQSQAARAAGRAPVACPPGGKIEVEPRQLLAHLNAIPASRRATMTTTDGVRHWMQARYPCPAA